MLHNTSFVPRLPLLGTFGNSGVLPPSGRVPLCSATGESMKRLQISNILFSAHQVLCFPALLK